MLKKNQNQPQVALRSTETVGRASVLGPTLKFLGGELSSAEDLVIEGTVEGSIAHHDNKLTITKTGSVKADIHAKVVVIEGSIEGNIVGDEHVHIISSARVVGNITAPSVTLEDGANFDGRIKTGKSLAANEAPSVRKAGSAAPKVLAEGGAAAQA